MKPFRNDERGATAIEYGLMATCVAVAIIVGVASVGEKLKPLFPLIADMLR